MRAPALAFFGVTAIAIAIASACGSAYDAEPSAPASDAGTEGSTTEEEIEPRADDFTCGPATCSAGTQACCVLAGGFSCVLIASGCGGAPGDGGTSSDAGADANATVTATYYECTTYRNCAAGRDCCYKSGGGGACKEKCGAAETPLCTLNADSCGANRECKTFASGPAPQKIGRCD